MFLLRTHLLQAACCSLDSIPEMCFTDCTHLLHVCDDISHLQSKLIVLLFLIGNQNHCLCCVCVCVCGGGGGVVGGMGRGSIRIMFQIKEMSHLEMYYIQT